MESLFLKDLVIILTLSIIVLLACHRLHIPTIVGMLLTGLLSGPHGLKLVSAINTVEIISQIGLLLLLFSIGMEFSLQRLISFSRAFFLGGSVAVGLTLLGGFVVAQAIGRPVGESLFLGCLLSLSSTAIVLKELSNRGEENSPHGRVQLAILIFQDVVTIPMILLVPILAGTHIIWSLDLLTPILEGGLILLAAFLIGLKVTPVLFYYIARTHSRELFFLAVLSVCLTVTWLAAVIGLSLSLGAFLAGLILSDTEYRHQAIGDILPVKDVFMSFFFISIGMLLDFSFVLSELPLIALTVLAVILLKAISSGVAAWALGMPLRTVILVALGLSQIGEFSFVLAKTGLNVQLGMEYHYQLFLAVSLVTMMICPLLIALAPHIASALCRLPWPEAFLSGWGSAHQESEVPQLSQHVIIVGFGLAGRQLARCCRLSHVDYIILDLDPQIVVEGQQAGEPIHFGDASHLSVLRHAHLNQARIIAIAVDDPTATRHIIRAARHQNSKLLILARTRHLRESQAMYQFGADLVLVDEEEAAIAFATQILRECSIEEAQISALVTQIRLETPFFAMRQGHQPRSHL